MGYYIQTDAPHGKAEFLVREHNAEVLPYVPAWNEVDASKAIICVVDNGLFEAAGFAYSANELAAFNRPSDMRLKTWLLMDRDKAKELTGYRR